MAIARAGSKNECGPWRIDELARLAGVSVDTVRFYRREALLPSVERNGRALEYGPEHLRRIGVIRELRSRRLSLAAIRELLDPARDRQPRGDSRSAFSEEFSEAVSEALAGVVEIPSPERLVPELHSPERLVAEGIVQIQRAGLMERDVKAGDMRVIEALARLVELGLPGPAIVSLARLYADVTAAMSQRLRASLGLTSVREPSEVLYQIQVLAEECHRRMLVTLAGAIRRS